MPRIFAASNTGRGLAAPGLAIEKGKWILCVGMALHTLGCSKDAQVETVKQEEKSKGQVCLDAASTERDANADAPERITLAHILVRHAQLARPQGATLNREEACLRALSALTSLESGSSWTDAVTKYSDSGKSSEGALGRVEVSDLDPAFGAAAFALEVDELSYVVESERGFHIILRTE